MQNAQGGPPLGGSWPEPRVRALQVDELYRFAGPAAGFSYFGALLTLGVLIEAGDIARGSMWFVWATAVTVIRFAIVVAYRQRDPRSNPDRWARLVIGANFLAGVQWGLLGTLLFPVEPGYRQLFAVMVIICFVAGSVTAYTSVRGAHEALAVPAALPTAIYLFFVQQGVHWFAGTAALFFCFAILYYGYRQNKYVVESYRLQIERDELLDLTAVLNDKLQRENRELAHRAAMRGASVMSARDRAARLEALFENSPLPQLECDGAGNVVACNLAAERTFGLRQGEITGRPVAGLLSGAAEVIATPRAAMSVAVQVRARDGEMHPCTANVTPLPAPEGIKPGFAVILSGLREPAEVR